MVSYSKVVNATEWFKISDDEDYILQNKGEQVLLVKASATEPVDSSASFEIDVDEVIGSTILSGVIWCKAAKKTTLVTYAK